LLGLKAARFGGTYGRACVCAKISPAAPAAELKMAAPAQAPGLAAPPAMAIAGHDEAPVDGTFEAGAIDCDSPAVRACLERPPRYRVPVQGLPTRGSIEFDVTIVEVGDFECPYCGRSHATMKALAQGRYGDKIRFAFLHLPLSFHHRAEAAALAAEAARLQGKYWPMHDRLFAHQKDLGEAGLRTHAKAIGLDMERFEVDRKSKELIGRIAEQKSLAQELGARGTPGFFINGRIIKGAQPLDVFEKEVRFALLDAQRLRRQAPYLSSTEIYQRLVQRGITKAVAPKTPKKKARPKRPEVQPQRVLIQPGPSGRGAWPPKVVIVAYSDYQCPFCRRGEEVMLKVLKRFPKDVYYLHRHNPLSFHPMAKTAAQAVEAAALQGKFWAMHGALFGHHNLRTLSEATIKEMAKKIGLNKRRFQRDLHSKKVIAQVEAQMRSAKEFGARGTPNYFINGKLVTGALPFERFEQLINKEIERAETLLRTGVLPRDIYEALLPPESP
jgi:protein-disulfide isomerase